MLRWGPVAACMSLMFGASSLSQVPSVDGVSDTAYHVPVYAVLALLVARALHRPGRALFGIVIGAAAWSVVWGGLDEFHQSFVPGRTASGRDLVADSIGSLIGCLIWVGIVRRRAKDEGPITP